VRCVREPRPGKGHAYNAGLREAAGEFLIFTDDDVRVPREWIAGLVAPLRDGRGDAVAGGVVLAPGLERPWLTPLMRSFLASTERFDPKAPHLMVGANMAFHRRVLQKVPAFDPELGPGTWYGLGEESLLAEQIKAAGFTIAGAPEVVVEHHCGTSRLQRQPLLGMARKVGRSEAYLYWHWSHEQVPRPALRWAWGVTAYARRYGWRSLRTPGDVEGHVSDAELSLVRAIAFHAQYLREARRPRNYERHGLVKVNG
jgi:GT2 family glycosyltransferase